MMEESIQIKFWSTTNLMLWPQSFFPLSAFRIHTQNTDRKCICRYTSLKKDFSGSVFCAES